MGDVLKQLLDFKGAPMIKHVFDAATDCKGIENIFVAITPKTSKVKDEFEAEYIETDGKGYVEDMVSAIAALKLKKTLILSADLPLLTSEDLSWVITEYNRLKTPALAVYVPTELYRDLGLKPSIEIDGLVPTGVNIVDGTDLNGVESKLVTENPRFAFNINTPNDLEKAVEFAGEKSGK